MKSKSHFMLPLKKLVGVAPDAAPLAVVVPLLSKYNLFGKNSLFGMALSSNPKERQRFCRLIEKYGGDKPTTAARDLMNRHHLCALSHDICTNGQFYEAEVSPVGSGYLLHSGIRRALAVAYGSIKYNVPMTLLCCKHRKSVHVRPMTKLEQAQYFKRLLGIGLQVREIALKVGLKPWTIRRRLALLKKS